jgi:SAM-dependent methyltransferase
MLIKELEGLKFPDIYVIRFFFKEGLDKKKGKVLELGCGNGNNLMMFYQYGWETTGVDINERSIKQAKNNFSKCKNHYGLTNTSTFITQDVVDFVTVHKNCSFDVLLLPNVICYIDEMEIIKMFSQIRDGVIGKDFLIFIRTRTLQDSRYGRGKKLGEKTFRMDTKETGEQGCLNTFLNESDLINILEDNFNFEYKRILHCAFDNYQMDHLTSNNDIIIWGKVKGIRK